MLGRSLRVIALTLLASLVVGFAIGTWIRWRLEWPVYYIGSAPASEPFDVGYAGAVVLDTGQDEQQVG